MSEICCYVLSKCNYLSKELILNSFVSLKIVIIVYRDLSPSTLVIRTFNIDDDFFQYSDTFHESEDQNQICSEG